MFSTELFKVSFHAFLPCVRPSLWYARCLSKKFAPKMPFSIQSTHGKYRPPSWRNVLVLKLSTIGDHHVPCFPWPALPPTASNLMVPAGRDPIWWPFHVAKPPKPYTTNDNLNINNLELIAWMTPILVLLFYLR